jgi:hypothetical protein
MRSIGGTFRFHGNYRLMVWSNSPEKYRSARSESGYLQTDLQVPKSENTVG